MFCVEDTGDGLAEGTCEIVDCLVGGIGFGVGFVVDLRLVWASVGLGEK